MLDVFISYAREDRETVDRLHDDLTRPGIVPWLDRERLEVGGSWNDEIERHIRDCSHFIAVVSPQSLQDGGFVRNEWDLALAQDKYIMPVRLEDCALPETFAAKHWQDLFPYEQGIVQLLRFLHREKRAGRFEETFSCNGPDNPGWVLDGWQLDDLDRTGRKSQSLHGAAGLSQGALLPQTVSRTATVEVAFTVVIDDGREQVVDQQAGAVDQAAWEQREVRLPALSTGRCRLGFRLRAHGGMNDMSAAKAWIDDIRVS